MARFPVPDEERLGRLIFEAHEYLPGPDMARLRELEERLNRKAVRRAPRRIPRAPWWLILLLAGGVATAAWWSLDRLRDRPAAGPPRILPQESGMKPAEGNRGGGGESGAQKTQPATDSPVIYRRQE